MQCLLRRFVGTPAKHAPVDSRMANAASGPTLVELWGGWSIILPASHYQRNEDGSWSAWGEDWAVDIHIIETSGDSQGEPVSAEQFLAQTETVRGERISGIGWIGTTETLIENDGSRDVYRLAGRLGAKNTLMSCWVSYVRKEQQNLAQQLINSVNHHGDGRVV
jgi:hypothetical protein